MADDTTLQQQPAADQNAQPAAPSIPASKMPKTQAPKATPRVVTIKKFVRSGEQDTGETFEHTLSDFHEELVDVMNPADPRLTPAQKATLAKNRVVTIKVQKPIAFARDNGYHQADGTPIVSEYTSEYREHSCPKCGHDLAITVTGTDDDSRGVKCLACGTISQ